jgi:hypothetical protein
MSMNITTLGIGYVHVKLRTLSGDALCDSSLSIGSSVHRNSGKKWKIEERLAPYPRTVRSG